MKVTVVEFGERDGMEIDLPEGTLRWPVRPTGSIDLTMKAARQRGDFEWWPVVSFRSERRFSKALVQPRYFSWLRDSGYVK